jgi:hypothetical protein
VVALKAVPADAKSEEKTITIATHMAYIRTTHPRTCVAPEKRRNEPENRLNFLGSYFRCVRILAQFAVTPIRESAKLFPIIYPRELQRMPEQCRLGN